MLHNALEGSDGSAASAAYTEAFRVIMRAGVGDKSPRVKIAAARCLKAFANIGGPGFGIGELENCLSYCVKVLISTCSIYLCFLLPFLQKRSVTYIFAQ